MRTFHAREISAWDATQPPIRSGKITPMISVCFCRHRVLLTRVPLVWFPHCTPHKYRYTGFREASKRETWYVGRNAGIDQVMKMLHILKVSKGYFGRGTLKKIPDMGLETVYLVCSLTIYYSYLVKIKTTKCIWLVKRQCIQLSAGTTVWVYRLYNCYHNLTKIIKFSNKG